MRLRVLFLVPLTVAIFTIVAVLGVMLQQNAQKAVEQGVIRIRASVQDFYEESVRYDANALHAVMDALQRDEILRTALSRKDRSALLRHSQSLFEKLRSHFNITHFYFTGTDRVNLLRVHAPLRYGDTIDRITMQQAQSSGTEAYGVELDPLGTFTLRPVSPWYDTKTKQLIGYVELGMEVDQVLEKLQAFFGVQVYTLIHKTYLDREEWEAGMRTLGRTPHWDLYPDMIASEQSTNRIPPFLSERLVRGELGNTRPLMELSYGDLSYRVTALPLFDVAGQSVAQMVLVANVSSEEDAARQTAYAGSLAAVVVGALLLAFFFWLTGRVGRRTDLNEKALLELATHDGLTGLYNQRTFYSLLEDEFIRVRRYKRPVSLLLLDIDHFKQVNDTYGHRVGDRILRGVSDHLMSQLRSMDLACRYGGEEMTVILPETSLVAGQQLADRLRQSIEKNPFVVDNEQQVQITVSIGVASFPEHGEKVSTLVASADKALYAAKKGGRNRVCIPEQQPGERTD